MKWYAFHPTDTLMCQGNTPLTRPFPPPESVISGAIRTTILAQKNISISRYRRGHPISERIGPYGGPAPFTVTGPILKSQADFFIPAPYTWFVKKTAGPVSRTPQTPTAIHESEPLTSGDMAAAGLISGTPIPRWIQHSQTFRCIGGRWIPLNTLHGPRRFYHNDRTLFHPESQGRMTSSRQPGMTDHIRLAPGTCLVWGMDRDCGLNPEGILSLGGAQRFGIYRELPFGPDFPAAGNQYLALSPVTVTPPRDAALIATGPIRYRGGWDMARGRPKPLTPFYPSGSVFSISADHSCIPFT